MNLGSAIVSGLNRGPLLSTEDVFVKKGRGLPIHGFVGPNGAGKSMLAALQTLPTLRGIQWACDNPDHLHTAQGITSGTRRVLSTMPFITPSGKPHPLYIPLTDFSQITFAEHVDLILDEVGGAVASATNDGIPIGVKASLQELRRREVVCRWTAPSWARASKVLREVSQAVTLTIGFLPVAHTDGVPFDGPHEIERLSVDAESLVYDSCTTEGPHSHDSGRLWGARRLMYARTFDATVFDEWTTAKREKVRPLVRHLFWRPGHEAERSYDTHGYVEKLNQITDSGTCDHCQGYRARKKCSCESPAAVRGAARRAAVVAGDTVEIVEDGEHVHS